MNAHEKGTANAHALAHINGGLHALRRALAARVPFDFGWSFNFSAGDVHAVYAWTGDSGARMQKEIRAQNVRTLLLRWQAIDWAAERREARENLAA